MKGEYADHHYHHHHRPKHESATMFTKLHHPLPFSTPFQLTRDSENDDLRSTGVPISTTTTATSSSKPTDHPPNISGNSDDATIEVVRRPRGRPSGSKNKPKPPRVITPSSEPPPMSPYILQVPGGRDVVDAISRFCRRKNIGVCVLTGSGTVSNVTLRQPSTTPSSPITFSGRFDILSISATFMPQTVSFPVPNTFAVSLAGPQGQVVGGLVSGSLVACDTLYVIAATFNNPSYHLLSGDDEGRNSGSGGGEGQSSAVSGTGGGGGDSGGGGDGGECSGGGGGGRMVMYSSHFPSDVIWPPPARPPPPPY